MARPIIKATVPQRKAAAALDYDKIESTGALVNTVGAYTDAPKGNVQDKDVQFFVGPEVEATWARQCKTLFVVGLQTPSTVLRLAQEHNVAQIYFGAKKSFELYESDAATEYRNWDAMITAALKEFELYCALDLNYEALPSALQLMKCFKYERFCPTVRFGLAVSGVMPKYTAIRFDGAEEGVWTVRLDDLEADRGYKFTPWSDYGNDHEVK